jgi:hypothetical protein
MYALRKNKTFPWLYISGYSDLVFDHLIVYTKLKELT